MRAGDREMARHGVTVDYADRVVDKGQANNEEHDLLKCLAALDEFYQTDYYGGEVESQRDLKRDYVHIRNTPAGRSLS